MKPKLRKSNSIRWGILAAALLMMGIGIMNGEMQTVFEKAVNICLECIGIG
ncbi:MAG: CD1871A family CXXC motif-containing protein [Gemmiger sp.]|nr:CD1871A family CXXC motif-containing protein [Gemmiger sp.]